MLCVVVDAPFLNDHLGLPEAVEDFAIQTFIPELALSSRLPCRPRQSSCLVPAALQSGVASSQPAPHSVSSWPSSFSFQFDTLISSGSEKAGQVNGTRIDEVAYDFKSRSPFAV